MKVDLRIHAACLSFLFSLFLFSGTAAAQTAWLVDQGGGGDFTAIQDCINAAAPGDTCQVNQGTYVENIDFIGKDLTVVKATKVVPIIDGDYLAPVATFENGETEDAVLSGFIVQHGDGSSGGGGIYCENASPTITDCTIRENLASNGAPGGGILAVGGSLEITDCTITDNVTSAGIPASGGGIHFSGDSLTLLNCTITGNGSQGSMSVAAYGGGIAFYGNKLWIENCDIRDNGVGGPGGGLYCLGGSGTILNSNLIGNQAVGPLSYSLGGGIAVTDASLSITNSTFTENTSLDGGGGIYSNNSSLGVTNSILWGDTSTYAPEIFQSGGTLTVTYTDVEGGWSGAGNIDQDPLFVDPAGDDYHLQVGSPCIDTGDNSAPSLPATDIDGQSRIQDGDNDSVAVVDMGTDEVPPEPCGCMLIQSYKHNGRDQTVHILLNMAPYLLPVGLLLCVRRKARK